MGKGKNKSGKKATVLKKNVSNGDSCSLDTIESPDFDAHHLFDVMPERDTQLAVNDEAVGQSAVKESEIKDGHQLLEKMPKSKNSAVFSGSASISRSLGTHDTVMEPASDNDNVSVEEEIPASNKKEANATPWVNLFKENRTPSKGLNLETFKVATDGCVLLDKDDASPLHKEWGYGLIGYVAGRFPGKKALVQCCDKWGVTYSFSSHDSGWLIFKFNSEEDRNLVLANGPYFIFQRPLLLKIMPELFDFGDEELSRFPVWVKLRNLPLEYWNSSALGKILSHVGEPIRTDFLTATRGSLSFARALVEVDASVDLVHEVKIKTHKGSSFVQHIEFENIPAFCKFCKVIGHNSKNCKANSPALLESGPKSSGLGQKGAGSKRDLADGVISDIHKPNLDNQDSTANGVEGVKIVTTQQQCANIDIADQSNPVQVEDCSDEDSDGDFQTLSKVIHEAAGNCRNQGKGVQSASCDQIETIPPIASSVSKGKEIALIDDDEGFVKKKSRNKPNKPRTALASRGQHMDEDKNSRGGKNKVDKHSKTFFVGEVFPHKKP